MPDSQAIRTRESNAAQGTWFMSLIVYLTLTCKGLSQEASFLRHPLPQFPHLLLCLQGNGLWMALLWLVWLQAQVFLTLVATSAPLPSPAMHSYGETFPPSWCSHLPPQGQRPFVFKLTTWGYPGGCLISWQHSREQDSFLLKQSR